eukprot:m.451736 g.451736  ORF g.451736 m.451736 type:complete len:82 (-) comp21532_c3_seq1:150-395(-)
MIRCNHQRHLLRDTTATVTPLAKTSVHKQAWNGYAHLNASCLIKKFYSNRDPMVQRTRVQSFFLNYGKQNLQRDGTTSGCP